jgi:type 1 fimbria pilin
MTISTLQPRSRVCSVAALVLLSACSAAANSILFLVTVNTSTVNTNSGFLDFQFNPGAPTSQAAVASILNFNADGGALVFNLNSPQVTVGVLGGPLPAPLTFTNALAVNEVFQQFTYGTFFSFVLSLSGPALSSPNGAAETGSTFGVGLFDQAQNPILTNQPSGFAGTVDVNLDGTTTATSFPNSSGGTSVVTFQALPEPGTMFLLGFGGAGLFMLRKVLR